MEVFRIIWKNTSYCTVLAKKTHRSILQISPLQKVRSLWNLKLKLITEKWTTNKLLVKICAPTRLHEAKMCTRVYQNFAHAFMLLIASCVHVQCYFAHMSSTEDWIFIQFKLKVMTLYWTINTKYRVKTCAHKA